MSTDKKVLIVYSGYSPTGSTATLAGWIANGVNSVPGVSAVVQRARDAKLSSLNDYDGIILGSGTYNGNPEAEMLEFADTQAGKAVDSVKLDKKIGGSFCTSGGYATGAQSVLQALSRIYMTFGATFVGGGNWHTSQGVCGMVHDNKDGTWQWADGQKYLQEDATDYGKRLGTIAKFFNSSFPTVEHYVASGIGVL